MQTTHYYPFGGVYADAGSGSAVQPYKYGGKELDRMHGLNWYDFGARPYDATLIQWTSIDPKAEDYYHLSPYAYCANNPVAFVDPNGEIPLPVIIWAIYEVGSAIYDAYTTYTTLTDADATTYDKAAAVGGVVASAVLPGGGYSSVSKVDDVVRAVNATDNVLEVTIKYRSFTARNFRENLARRTGEIPEGHEAHHMLPKKFEEFFTKVGLDINNPMFGKWLKKIDHSKGSYRYNQRWEAYTEECRKNGIEPTKEQVIDKMSQFMYEEYGIQIKKEDFEFEFHDMYYGKPI